MLLWCACCSECNPPGKTVVYDYEINHLPSSLRWWKCTSFQLLPYVIFMKTETYRAGWFVANRRVLLCFLRASCLLCSFLGFSGSHRTWTGSRSPPLWVLCAHVTLLERWTLYAAADPWKGQECLCRLDVLWEIGDGPSCVFVSEYSLLMVHALPFEGFDPRTPSAT